MAEHAGAAKRRRERRLRAYLRCARTSVAMALAESNHHAAPREQNMARAEEEGHEEKHNAPWRQKHPPPQRPRADAGTQTEDDAEHTVQVVFLQERISERFMERTIVASSVPQNLNGPDTEYVTPAPAVTRRRRLAMRMAPAPAAACAVPTPRIEYASPSPAGTCAAPAPVTEYASTSPAARRAPKRHQLQ